MANQEKKRTPRRFHTEVERKSVKGIHGWFS